MMRILSKLFGVGLCVSACLLAPRASADLEVSGSVTIQAEADFYEPLTPHGAWVEVESYGRCWHPGHVSVEWWPYSDGYWVWTDCGYYWVSSEPWAWACYHYGSWVHHGHHGWIWVPGVRWAPAWVTWRVGGGYIGWAPLPPPGLVSRVAIPPPPFLFIEERHFHEPVHRSRVIVNNTTIINKTTVINNVREEQRAFGAGKPQKVVVNEGPGAAPVERVTGKKLTPEPIQKIALKTPGPKHLPTRPDSPPKQSTPPAGPTPSSPTVPIAPPATPTPTPGAPPAPKDVTPPGSPVPAPIPAPVNPPKPKGNPGKPSSQGDKGKDKPL